jgi:hypothetical protein
MILMYQSLAGDGIISQKRQSLRHFLDQQSPIENEMLLGIEMAAVLEFNCPSEIFNSMTVTMPIIFILRKSTIQALEIASSSFSALSL